MVVILLVNNLLLQLGLLITVQTAFMILRIITIGYLHVNDFLARVLEDVLMLTILGLKLYEFIIFEKIIQTSGFIDKDLMYKWNQIGWITAYL
jgi:hypothetical protein